MNARQMKKRMKKQIDKLQSDNDLMRKIIADSPTMQSLYDAYNRPLNVTYTTVKPVRYMLTRRLETYGRVFNPKFIELLKEEIARDLFARLKDDISYEIESNGVLPRITGSIYVCRK
jgi:hypothetical protein